jgi:hypothetical protein
MKKYLIAAAVLVFASASVLAFDFAVPSASDLTDNEANVSLENNLKNKLGSKVRKEALKGIFFEGDFKDFS